MPKAKETVLEINLKALEHNFNFLKAKLNGKTKFLAVVKAFAYGNAAVEIATYLEQLNVDYFAVAYVNEGIFLRDAGITTPILVLHPQKVNFSILIERCLEPTLYNAYSLNAFIETAEEHQQKNYPIHLKFNTGLNRLGFWENDVDYIVERLKNVTALRVKSVFSHLAASEDLNEKEFTLHQIDTFKKIATAFASGIGYRPLWHQLNTSGILNYARIAQFDMVRSGIGLYGFGNAPEYRRHLKPIATLKSVISQIHHIEKGETVGYNRAYSATTFTKTATIPIGHADGIGRHYGNGKGFITVHGSKAPIVGNICMDMLMADISGIDCKEGDEVILFGDSTTAEVLAERAGTISYELIAGISQRVKRVIVR